MREQEQHIINTSIDLFAKNGIRNVSVKKIAEKLKISKGQIYYYFEDGKNDIVSAILQMFEELIAKNVPSPEECEEKDADAAVILSKLFFKFSESESMKYRKILRIVLSEMFYNEQIKDYITTHFVREREKMLALCLNALVSDKKIKPMPSSVAARFFNRLLIVYALLDALELPDDKEALYERFVNMERDCMSFIDLILTG